MTTPKPMRELSRATVKAALRDIFPSVPDDELERLPSWVDRACCKLFRLDEAHSARAEIIRRAACQLEKGYISE